jgi:serine/threonine protein phosphatase 1
MENRVFVLGDIHGNYLGLKQCFERSGFDYENDTLISIGDIVDGWSQSFECVEELLKVKNHIPIIGNHDEWFLQFIEHAQHPQDWAQGGKSTLDSYALNCGRVIESQEYMNRDYVPCYRTSLTPSDIPESHIKFFKSQNLYYIDDQNRLFVHGGYNRLVTIREAQRNNQSDFYWNRIMWEKALSCKGDQKLKTEDNFSEIFIGHTATTNWSEDEEVSVSGIILSRGKKQITTPMHSGGVWNVDTGAGWGGKLTIMNIDTHEYWQSDLCKELYPNEQGRK